MELTTDIKRLSASALAYLGDAVYELHVRRLLLEPPKRTHDYHQAVVDRVRATAQSDVLQALHDRLSPDELAIVQRGKNQCGRIPRNVDPQTYRQASGFEALLGFLYLSDPQRLSEVLAESDRSTTSDPTKPYRSEPSASNENE
ncbi:MAG: ribonuclease III domain-containing protein [Cyanobacteria bacterium P01_A01_bin.3]